METREIQKDLHLKGPKKKLPQCFSLEQLGTLKSDLKKHIKKVSLKKELDKKEVHQCKSSLHLLLVKCTRQLVAIYSLTNSNRLHILFCPILHGPKTKKITLRL